MPKWMGRIDQVKPPTAAGLGAALIVVNPKNLILAVAGAAEIAQTGILGSQQALAYVIFGLISTIGVAVPVVIDLVMRHHAATTLDRLKRWMSRNNAVILSVICVIIAAKLIGDAISALTS